LISERAFSIALVCFLLSGMFASVIVGQAPEGPSLPARMAQDDGMPTAVIGWLPDVVSNGTWWFLNGSGSSDVYPGVILTYTWRIVVDNRTTFSNAEALEFKFSTLGLHKIYLTVTDDEGHTDEAFWAVYSIPDADGDSLPDWWEDRYWPTKIYGLDHQSGGGDPDGDKYSNLEEYNALTDPTDASSHPMSFWVEYRLYIIVGAIVSAVAIAVSVRFMLKRHRELEKKKIEYAIEIDKELSEELEVESDGKEPEK